MRYFSGAIYKLLKTMETCSKHEEILKISSICTSKEVERGKAVLKVNPLDEQLAKKYFLEAEEQRKTARGGKILANAALFLTLGRFGLDSLVKHGPSSTWEKVEEKFTLVDLDKDKTKDQMKNFLNASDDLAKAPDLEKLEMKIKNIETQLSEILKVLKENGKPKSNGAVGEKRAGKGSVSKSERDD